MSISISVRGRRSRSTRPLSLLMMDIPWLLAAIIGLAATKVSCQEFGDLPPLPDKGVRLYLGLQNIPIPNYAMIAGGDFIQHDGNSGGLNRGLWCQSAMDVDGIGSWKLPNGSAVSDDLNFMPINMANRPGQVGLLRDGSIGPSPYQGMYTCTIPDENGVNQTLVVWAGGATPYKEVNLNPDLGVMNESFIPSIKPRDTDPPELVLSFNVIIAAPTDVTCQVDSTPVNVTILSRKVTAGEYQPTTNTSSVTNVNVTLRTRQAGNYTCTVSVYRASGEGLDDIKTAPISISVTDTPMNVKSEMTGEYTVQLSWSAPASNTPPVAGYEVFYAVSGSNSTHSGGTTTTNTTTINMTLPSGIYDLFVVAFSDEDNALPSAHSDITTIYLIGPLNLSSTSDSITVSWTAPQSPPTGYVLTPVCMLLCGDPLQTTSMNATSSNTSVTFSGIPPGSECNITLTAQGSSTSSNEPMVTATTLSEKPSATPTNFSVESKNSSSITLTWDEIPCSSRNGPLLHYNISYIPDGGTTNTAALSTGSDQLTGLMPCTRYILMIAAENDAGVGNFSSPLAVISNGNDPPDQVAFNMAVRTLTNITISWTAPSNNNGVILKYMIQFTNDGNSTIENITELMYAFEDLAPSTKVEFSVSAVSICGLVGEPSVTNQSTDAIPVTDEFSTERINSTAVQANWSEVASDYLDHYTVYYYPNPAPNSRRKRQNNEQNATFPAGNSSGVIGGLDEDQDYLFSLAVTFNINGQLFEGERTDSVSISEMTTQPPTTEPPTTDSTITTVSTTTDSTTTDSTTTTDMDTDVTASQAATEAPSSSNTTTIAGAVVGILLVVIVVIVVVVILVLVLRRRQAKSKHYVTGHQRHKPVHFSKNPVKEEQAKLTTVPVIEHFPGAMTVEEGRQVEFKVLVKGIPPPSYKWYHDDQRIQEDYAHEVTEEGCLIVVTAEQKHKGTYKLVAENAAGVAEKSLTLVVNKETDEDTAPLVVNGDSANAPGQFSLDAIPVAEFGQYVANCHADNNKGFQSLYNSLNGREGEHPVTVAVTPSNKPFNRFANITVYDDNRIILKPMVGRSDCQGDYINACYINGYSIPHKFIATQGPMSKTLVDFWRLVWQEKPQSIVMVTNLKEEKKVKCHLYWPETGSQDYGPFRVTLADQQVLTDYSIRLLQVELSGSSEYPHRVTQYHFTSWPDHGVPEYATPILTLHRQTKQNHKPKRGPILVHCSAGVGRTGTFIAIDMALEKIENEGVVDISNIVIQMRQQRMKMVQTVDQFIFICDAILESITCGDTQIPTANLRQDLSKLRTVDPHTGKTGFQQQFDVLSQVTPNPAEVKHDVASRYPEQNRTLEFAPPDKHRVPLKGASHDYIHATFINGYKQKKAFIIAQSPMENTCRDFWKMIVQRNCGVIIMLCQTKENGKETCAQYWSSVGGETLTFGEFFVQVQNEVNYPGFVERTLSITEKDGGNAHKVLQLHITNWACPGRCSNLQTIVSVQEEMYKVQRRTGNNPVVVHCSDTVSRSGMFCAIATAIDRCKTEGLVDVFQVVKAQRIQKPGLVRDVAQYEQVFEAIQAFLDSFETYTNFQ